MKPAGRLRSLSWFFIAAIYFVFAQQISGRAASGFNSGDLYFLLNSVMLLFLLLVGYAAMGYAAQGQREPLRAMGLARREGWRREFALGASLGWGGMVASVLPMAVLGGLVLTFWTQGHQFYLLGVNLLTLLAAAIAEEVAFRGYPFQRLIDAIGPTAATLVMSILFGLIHVFNSNATAASTLVTVLAGWLFSLAYLRTRALWLPCGMHFAWNVSMGMIFGLPVSGLTVFSPVISAHAMGPTWLTGGYYGPEGSAVTAVVLLGMMIVLMRVTRGYAHQYAQPVIVPGGMPVDVDAIARRQHEAAMGPAAAPEGPKLVQILPVSGTSFSATATAGDEGQAGTQDTPDRETPRA